MLIEETSRNRKVASDLLKLLTPNGEVDNKDFRYNHRV